MSNENAISKIAKAALTEEKNRIKSISLTKNGGMTEITTGSQFVCEPVYYYVVSLEDKPITKERYLRFDPDIKFTKGMYTIQYLPKASLKRNPKFPYLIGQDLVRIRVTVSGPRHWGCVCKRIPELGWIKRNSTFRDEMFAIAKKHPGLVLRFGVDFCKYCKTIEERAEREGLDIDHKPLFTYLWNNDMKNFMSSVDVTGWQKSKSDYEEVLHEIESSQAVLKEIKGD